MHRVTRSILGVAAIVGLAVLALWFASVLRQPAPALLVLSAEGLARLDTDGNRTPIEVADVNLGKLQLLRVKPNLPPMLRRGSSVVILVDGVAYAVTPRGEQDVDTVTLGHAAGAFPAVDDDRVWLWWQTGTDTQVRQVDVDGTATAPETTLPPGHFPYAATEEGLLLRDVPSSRATSSTGEAPRWVMWQPDAGTTTAVDMGALFVEATATRLVRGVFPDNNGALVFEIVDPGTGRATPIPPPPGGRLNAVTLPSPSGRWLVGQAVHLEEQETRLILVDLREATSHEVSGTDGVSPLDATWIGDRLYFPLPTSDSRTALAAYSPSERGGVEIVLDDIGDVRALAAFG